MSAGPSSDPGEDPPPPPNVQDIKDQFGQQQTLIAQLKETLVKNEQQLVNKEKQVEGYAAKFADIKTRSKASKRSSRAGGAKREVAEEKEKDQDQEMAAKLLEGGEAVLKEEEKKKKPGKSSEKSRQGNLNLLRKKLEESRVKFERGKEMTDSKQIEEKVEQLRMQVEERDQKIQELQRGLEAAPQRTPGKAKLNESESFQHPGSPSISSEQPEMYAQMVYKDNKIVELNNRIFELEANILDLQENLKEKDAVLDARTRAITLMSDDMSRKSKTTLDTLDETREQMRFMQHNFVALESQMKEEKEQLNKQLEAKERRLLQVEESNRKLESVRYDLSTRIAELQGKVVNLQTQNAELQKQGTDKENREGSQIEELTRALDDTNKQMIKTKAQHKNKMKQLTKQLDSLKKGSDAGEEILQLQQRVAELEEDKGNLQLHLVDFDELKAGEERLRQQVHELEEKVKQQNHDLDSHLYAISMLETEKLDLVQGVQDGRNHIVTLEHETEVLRTSIAELENVKVSAEMKAVELEEQVDILSRDKMQLQEESAALASDKERLEEKAAALAFDKVRLEEEAAALASEKARLENETSSLAFDKARLEEELVNLQSPDRSFQMLSSNEEEKWRQMSMSEETSAEKHVKDSSNLELSLKLLESELEETRRTIAEQKDIIVELNLKLEAREEEIEMHLEVIAKLEQLGHDVRETNDEDTNKISEIVKELNEMAGDLEEWKSRCSQVEDRLKCLEDEKVGLEKRLEEVTSENSLLNSQLRLQKEVSQDLVSKVNEQTALVSEQGATISKLEHAITEYRNLLNLREKELTAMATKLESLRVENSVTTVDEGELTSLKSAYSEMEAAIVTKDAELQSVRKLLEERESMLKDLQEKLSDTENRVTSQVENLSQCVAERDVANSQLMQQCQQYSQKLVEMQSSHQATNNYVQQLSSNLDDINEQLKVKNDELSSIRKELEMKISQLSIKEEEHEKSAQKMKEQTEKMKKLAANLKAKALVVRNHEEKEKQLQANIEEKEKVISQLTSINEQHTNEQNSLQVEMAEKMRAIDALSEKYVTLETSLRSEESKIEGLVEHIRQLSEKNVLMESELATLKEERVMADTLAEEHQTALNNQLIEVEREMSILQMDVRNKADEIALLKEENKKLEEDTEKKGASDVRIQQLIDEIMRKEGELTEMSAKLELLSNISEEKEKLESNMKELERVLVGKEMQLSALEEQLSGIGERYQSSWAALEAKHQEREAFIESLEQELTRSRTREQHMEGGLSNLEERRRFLEAKFEALGERLQESDRIKEEVEEHEGMLEQRLSALLMSEEALRKRLENLSDTNSELTQKVSELKAEEENLKRGIISTENTLKNANKEIERLTSFETAYTQILEKVESLEAELKHSAAEFERSLKERMHIAENLETDLKNVNNQAQLLDTEKHALMEHCEKLNDLKCNLEEEVEELAEKNEANVAKINELQASISQKQSEIEEKEKLINELKERNSSLEVELQNKNDNSFVEVVREPESDASQLRADLEMQIKSLTGEITKLKSSLAQKEAEVHSYQSRMLQLQFGNSSGDGGKISELEEFNYQLQEHLREKEQQLNDFAELMACANSEMDILKTELISSRQRFQDMSSNMCGLQEEIKLKDNLLHQQIENLSQISLSQQVQRVRADYESCFTSLVSERDQLYRDLLEEKAKAEVSNIISLAESRVEETKIKNLSDPVSTSPRVRFQDTTEENLVVSSIVSQVTEEVQQKLSVSELDAVKPDQDSITSQIEELQQNFSKVKAELDAVTLDRDSAILQIQDLQEMLFEAKPELDAAKPDHNLTISQIEELHQKLSEVKAELNTVKLDRDSAISQIEELVQKLSEAKAHLDAVKLDQDSIISHVREELQQKLSEAKAELENVKLDRDSVISHVRDELQQKFFEVKSELDSLKTERDLLIAQNKGHSAEQSHEYNLETELTEAQFRLNSVIAERDAALARIDFLSKQSSVESECAADQAPSLLSSSPDAQPSTGEGDVLRTEAQTVIDFGSSSWEDVGAGDEGWGWGSEEAHLEEEHLQKQQQEAQLMSESSEELKLQISQLQTKVSELECEKEKLLEDVKASQIRSGKMLKKLKDFKTRNESLMRENQHLASKKSNDFGDLDSAIEEELKIRIDSLEKEVKEVKSERDSIRAEKDNLAKRVDTLTAANERFMDMKERQDFDVGVWQRKNRELMNQIEALQWRLGEVTETGGGTDHANWSETPATARNAEDLQEQVAALAMDNEHLQHVLEEQRNLRLMAEATVRDLQRGTTEPGNDNMIVTALQSENARLKEYYEAAMKDMEQKDSVDHENLKQHEGTIEMLHTEHATLKGSYEALYQEMERLQSCKRDYDTLLEKYTVLVQVHELLRDEMNSLSESYYSLKVEYEILKTEMLTFKGTDATQKMEELEAARLHLEESYMSLSKDQASLLSQLQRTLSEKEMLQQQLSQQEIPRATCENIAQTLPDPAEDEQQKKIIELSNEVKKRCDEIELLREMMKTVQQERADAEQELRERFQKEINNKNEDISRLQTQFVSDREKLEKMYVVIQDLNLQLSQKEEQMLMYVQNKAKDDETQSLHEALLQQVSAKEQELRNMQIRFTEKERESNEILHIKDQDIDNLKLQISERERQIEESVFVKDEDIQNLRIQLTEMERHTRETSDLKDGEIYNLQIQLSEKDAKIYELTQTLHEEERHLESRERELTEALQLANSKRSEQPKQEEAAELETELNQQQSELDLALYMLHQRDVRCDELTLELMQLLEERDTLQLRLSTALRINEELRSKMKQTSTTSSPIRIPPTMSSSSSSSESFPQQRFEQILIPIEPQPITHSVVVEEPREDLQILANKLSQLHSIDYRRDVTVRDESEQRHSEQMQLLQQRGAGVVLESNYTLSRDVQSPSTVLLNWIWGRSTPRVMHI